MTNAKLAGAQLNLAGLPKVRETILRKNLRSDFFCYSLSTDFFPLNNFFNNIIESSVKRLS
jgi:hypothetical protein